VYSFVSRIVVPGMEKTMGDRLSHIDGLTKSAGDLRAEAEKIEYDAFVALENDEIDAAAAEAKLIAAFREQNIREKEKLYETFSKRTK
jgi:hypothetical protein